MVSYLTSALYVVDAAPTMLEQVDCRQSICRVVLREEDLPTMFRLSQLATTDEYRFAFFAQGSATIGRSRRNSRPAWRSR